MKSRFEESDVRASESVGRIMEEPVQWQPYRRRKGMTGSSYEPDPTRPVMDGMAVVSWRPEPTQAGSNQSEGAVISADCVVDMDRGDFDPDQTPRRGDRFALSDPYMHNAFVVVDRIGDDGSARLVFFCVFGE
jgi:hypothetical protein